MARLRIGFAVSLAWVCMFNETTLHADSPSINLDIRKLMTSQEFDRSGLKKLNDQEIRQLNEWLEGFTVRVVERASRKGLARQRARDACRNGFTSHIDNELEELSGDTVIKLLDGSIWQQIDGHYAYNYTYMASVNVFTLNGACMMLIEGFDKPIQVMQIR